MRFCERCGTEVSTGAAFCSGCGAPHAIGQASIRANVAAGSAPVIEYKLLEEAGITVTDVRFIVPAQTYAMAGITSVRTHVTTPSRLEPIALTSIAVLSAIIVFANGAPLAGIIMLGIAVAGVLWYRSIRSTYTLNLTSASGESVAFASKDQELVVRVVNAINEAIILRG